MNDKYNEDYIDDYLKEQLDSQEVTTFEQHLQENKTLADRVAQDRLIIQRIKVFGRKELMNQVQQIDQGLAQKGFFTELEKTAPVPKKTSKAALAKKIQAIDQKLANEDFFKKLEQQESIAPEPVAPEAIVRKLPPPRSRKKVWSIAASVAVLLMAGWWIAGPTTSTTDLSYPIAYQDVLSSKLTNTTGFTERPAYYQFLETGIQAYNSEKYTASIQQFEQYFQQAPPDDTYQDFATFYTALAQLQTDHIDKGITQLEQLTTKEFFELTTDTKWLLALGYLKYRKDAASQQKATRYLESLVNDAQYGSKASAILEKL